ncbi:MAG: DUF6008 family protein, partial [Pseudonocardiaceae bacterium]
MQHPAGGSLWGVILLTAFFVVLVGGVAVLVAIAGTPVRRVVFLGLGAAAGAAAAFQVGHFVEHIAQAGHWLTHPGERPWMTPWGAALAAGLARLDAHNPAQGMELLHLIGNAIFLAGVLALVLVARTVAAGGAAHRAARWCLWVQGAHVIEHMLLTATVATGGKAIGLSTMFGMLDPGPALWTYRIWWHFAVNLVATALVLVAIRRLRPARSPA